MSMNQNQAIYKLVASLPLFAEHNLKIKPKVGNLIPLRYNQSQLYLHKKLEEQKARTGKVRAIIVKGRQQGISTYIGSRYYHNTTTQPARSSFVFAHNVDSTAKLFSMVTTFYEQSDASFRPAVSRSNTKELVFHRLSSVYKLGTAGSRAGLGRGETIQNLHWSEVAYSPDAEANAKGIFNAVPDLPDTEIMLESTANGANDYFHRFTMQALSESNDWQVIFIPWYWMQEYRKPITDNFELTKEEADYLSLYAQEGLTKEHLAWRRGKLVEMESNVATFMHEYPFNLNEAFITDDEESYIKADDIIRARKTPPIDTDAPLVIGVDPARLGGDRIALAHARGRNLVKLEQLPKMKLSVLKNHLARRLNNLKPIKMFIDVGGLGAGLCDELETLGFGRIVEPVNFGSRADEPDRFSDKRAEMYYHAKKWLENTPCSIYQSKEDAKILDTFQAQLSSVQVDYRTHDQRLKMESKTDMKTKRKLPSPDLADAFILTLASPVAKLATNVHSDGFFISEARDYFSGDQDMVEEAAIW